ncbi:GNAT family N-acetyltransferase, partial [Pantoea vagans]
MKSLPLFSADRPAGTFTLRPMLESDAPLIHSWVTRDYARFWGMQQQSLEQVAAFYQTLTATDPHAALIGCCNDQPVCLIECYRAGDDEVGKFYPAAPDDYG